MSPDRSQLSSDEDDPVPESPNMVLSTAPIESGHVIIQEQSQLQQQSQQSAQIIKHKKPQLITNIKNNNFSNNHQIVTITSSSAGGTSTGKLTTITSTMPSSKLLVLQQNHLNDSTGTTTYVNGQEGGKIVLVATEQMDVSNSLENHANGTTIAAVPANNTNDEELTSLTWLHDKNLLKGINLSCPTNVKHINNNHIKIVSDNAVRLSQNHTQSSSSGAITPTSDFLDDSCVSEENVSSANSSSDQGISIYSTNSDTSPTSYHFISTTPSSQQAINNNNHNNNNNNNSVNNKNRNINVLNHNQPPPATSIIHLSPGGSTVIEYKTTSNLQQKLNAAASSAAIGNSQQYTINGGEFNNGKLTSATSISNQPATPHQHFHKKYIKQMNALNGSISTVATVLSSPTSITVNAPTTYTIPINHEYSPVKYDHETVIVENEFPHATITLSNSQHIERTDDYVTPLSSPRQQQQPSTPQKSIQINTMQSPTSASISNSIGTSSTSPTAAIPPNSPSSLNKQKHPNNLPYDPFIHTNNKPPLSFSSLIFLAIEDAQEKALPVKEIYAWIVQHYPYFKTAPTGWKNSVRHNLSLNKCFQKVEKAPNMGKGSLWRVEQQYKQNLIIALTRSSYHPNTTAMEKATASFKNMSRSSESPPLPKSNTRPLDAELFPRLSKFMANMTNGNNNNINNISSMHSPLQASTDDEYQLHNGNVECYHVNGDGIVTAHHNGDHEMHTVNGGDIETQHISVERIARDWGVDSIDDVNAATAMLALKHGPKVFAETFQTGTPIITSVPSEDHTYSAGGAGKRSSSTINGTSINSNHSNINSTINIITTTNLANNNNSNTNHINNNTINNSHNNSDNNSNGTSSDAAYESSEESQNIITAEELEARRHQEGVDAFLSFATEVSSMSSPIKRPPSADYLENIPNHHFNNNHIITNNNNNNTNNNNNNGNTQSYYYYDGDSSPSSISSIPLSHHNHPHPQQHVYSYLSAPSPPKKSRTRTLRTKLKKKTWLR